MTRVMYDSKRLIPAPLVAVNKQYSKTGDGTIIGSVFGLTITGKLVAHMGSPNSSGLFFTSGGYPSDEVVGTNSRLKSIIRKQEALRDLFSDEGRMLEFQSADGTAPMKCNPRVIGIEFSPDIWYNYCDYTINLEADVVYVNGLSLGEDSYSQYIEEASESWSFDTDEERPESLSIPRTYRVTHSVSAKGKRFYNDAGTLVKPAWKWAQEWVQPKIGFDNTIALSSGVNNLPSYYGTYNNVRSEQIDEIGGTYSINETFVLCSGTAIEEFTVTNRSSIDAGINTVTIEGNVTGLEQRDSNHAVTNTKYANASTKFSEIQGLLASRAQTYSGITLNATAISTVIGKNPLTGTITYTYEYNDRPSNIITGARSEVISVQDNWGVDTFAPIFVLGRTAGPVIQNLGTHRERTRNVNIEIVMATATGTLSNRLYTNKPSINATTAAEIQTIINTLSPANFGATNVNVNEQNQSWDGSRYSLNVGWTFELSNPDAII